LQFLCLEALSRLRAGLNERETPKSLAQLHNISHALVSTLQKHRSQTSKLIRFGSLHFRDNWGDHVLVF